MSAESESADVFDFVDAYLADLERGVDRPLAYWLERFPRSAEAVAREWVALREPKRDTPAVPSGASGSLEDGTARIGPYRLIRELGRGGQGTVFLAEDTRIARRVALKSLTSRFESISDEKRQRFRREAEVIARLEHPGLCTIHDADLDGDSPWIAMRYLEGRTLAECLADARAKGGGDVFGLRLPPTNATEVHAILFLVERAARALHAAHEAGVIHRDVKPGNVIVTLDGRPVVLDFGLARDETSATGTLTQSGDVFGTPAYMSPEQLTSPSSALDRRTDVYSLGALAFEALTLERPFERASRTASYRAILEDPTPDPRKSNPALSEDVRVVIETALEKDRARRYATALDLAEDLRRIREYEPIHARPASVGLRFARWMRRHPAIAAATLGTILALSIGLAVALKLLADERAALRHALGRQLALRAEELALEDPPRALAVGIEAIARAETDLTRGSLFTALDACWLERYVDPGADVEGKPVTAIATARHAPTAAAAWENGLVWVTDLTERAGGRVVRPVGSAVAMDLELSADGTELVLATADGGIVVHDLAHDTAILSRSYAPGRADVAFAPDGRHVVVRDAGGAVHVLALDGVGGDVVLAGEAGEFTQARVSPDGTHVLALSTARGLVVADARDGRVVRSVCPAGVTAFDAVGAGPGALALLACADRTLRVVELASGTETRAPLAFDGDLVRVVARRDGAVAIVIAADGEEGWAYWCDLATGATRRLEEHGGRRVTEAAFGPDGTRFATSSWDTTVRLWDARDGEHLRACMVTRRQLDVAWSDDGERLVTRAITGPPLVWYARVRPDLFDLDGHAPGAAITCVGFSSDGRRAVSASEDGTARVWDVDRDDARGLGRALALVRHDGPVRAAAWLDADRVLATWSDDGSVGTWSSLDGRPLRARAAHPAPLGGAAFDPTGRRFVTWSTDGVTRLWSVREDGAPLVVADAPAQVACAAFSPDGERLALGGADDVIVIVDPRDGRALGRSTFERKWSGGGVIQVAFRSAGPALVAACGDQFLRQYATSADGALTETTGHKSPNAVEMRLDASGGLALLRSRFGRGAVNLLDLATGRARSPRLSHSADLTSAVFSPAGDYVMTTSKDGTARVWRAQDFVPFARRGGFAGSVTCGDLCGAGESLRAITGTSTGRVAVWPIDPAPAARARMPRELTATERNLEAELAAPLEFR